MSPTSSRGRRRGRLPRLAALVVLLAAVAAAGWYGLGRSVLVLDGERRLNGLHAPVEILFDRYGVPHIYARDATDAWMAVGYLHARERLWQMELYRRATGGRLSEVLGPATLRVDRRFVALGLRRAAAAEWQVLSPHVRSALERYAEGVNAAIGEMGRWNRPPEFLLLGITPEPWTPVDSLSVARLLAWRLAENRWGELLRGRLTQAVGPIDAARLMNAWPPEAPPILREGPAPAPPRSTASPAAPVALAVRDEHRVARAVPPPLPPGLEWLDVAVRPGGSNSWVVSGARTATGRPLLANDPHLAIEMPATWYEVHVVAAGLDVAGVTLPAAPFVIIGHNARIAWGLTNTGVDVQDLYVEDVDMTRRRYLYRGQWLPLESTVYEIGVRGQERPERWEVFRTRHGPLVFTETEWEEPPDLAARTGRLSPKPIALRWDVTGETAPAFEAINRAGNWSEFLAGVRRFAAPSQNFVYADVDGHIGYAMSGRLPVRVGGDGSRPVPGWTGEHDWAGWVPAERLPALLDPPSGQIVTANAEIDRRWPGTMTRDWTAPFRTMRIVERLDGRTGLDSEAMRTLQLDVRSAAVDPLLDAVEAAAASRAFERADPEARVAVERLRLWDRQVDGRPVVTLYQAFVRALWRRTFLDELGEELSRQLFEYGASERHVGLYAIARDPASPWWNDIATIDRRETRDDIVLLAAGDAMRALAQRFGNEANWAWDRLHSVTFRHALGHGGRLLDWFFSRGPLPLVGDSWTVRKASVDDRSPYTVTESASYRQVLDIGDWDRSLAVITTGQSGHPRSPHYDDQLPLWHEGRLRPMPFSRGAVERERAHRLLLIP
ncbi:MAG TPA: penicillin acylase family protein [Vicinamibacterales bacterium]